MTDIGKQDTWEALKIATDGVPMVDAGTGKPLVLRTFEFKLDYKKLKEAEDRHVQIDKQMIFNSHWPQIKNLIWADGLVASTDVDPRVVIGKTRYRIFILCEPKFRVVLADKPTDLQTIFKKRLTKNK